MGATRDKIYESFEKKKKAKETGPNTRTTAGIETFTKPGHEGWKIDKGPPQKKSTPKFNRTPKPRATPDKLATSTPVGGRSKIKKVTFDFGKDAKGKAIGKTTVVALGKNPSAAAKIKGARLARNLKPTGGTAPQAKAPATSDAKWGPQGAYRMPKEAAPPKAPAQKGTSSSAKKILAAVGLAGAAVATTLAMKPKRNKSAAVTAAKARKPITTPTAPAVERVKPWKAPQVPTAVKPKTVVGGLSIVPKPVTTPKAPKAPKAPEAPKAPTTAAPATPAKKGIVESLRDAFKPETEFAELQAAEQLKTKTVAAKVEAPASITTPVDTSADVEAAKAQVKEIEGRLARTVKAPGRAAKKVTGTVRTAAAKVKQGVKDAVDPNIAETVAARKAKAKAPAPAPAEVGEFDHLSPDQREARVHELEARIETGRANQEAAKAKKAKPPVKHPTTDLAGDKVVTATPEEIEEVKLRDVESAKQEAGKLAARIHEAEKAPNVQTEGILETTPDERRVGEQRVEGRRDQTTRQTKVGATTESRARTIGAQQGSRRKRGSERRGATPAPEKPLTSLGIAAGRPERRVTTTIVPGGKRPYDAPKPKATPGPAIGNNAVTKVDGIPEIKTPKISEGDKALKAAAAAPADQAMLGKELEAAKKRAVEITSQVEAAGVADTANQTSRSATGAEATKTAATPTKFTPWTEEQYKASTPESREAYKEQLARVVEGESSKEAGARKKATQKFYTDKQARGTGEYQKGSPGMKGYMQDTKVSPEVAGAKAAPEPATPVYKARRPTEELMKEQGVEARTMPSKEAPETDATTEDWEKKKRNAEATRTPLEQAKLEAKEIGIQIAETEAGKNTLGAKIKEAAGVPETLTADMADFKGKRIVQSILGGEGEFETTILEGDALEETVLKAQEDLRKGVDRRSGEATRRDFKTRSTAIEASELIAGSERGELPGDKQVGAKKGSRREKQTGGDRRQKGSTWKPVDIAAEIAKPANERPMGLPDRRGATLLDLPQEEVFELKDSAERGDPIAKETLKQYRAELKGVQRERRAADTAPREAAARINELEHKIEGTGKTKTTSVWDPKAEVRIPATQMNVNADLMPEVDVYSGDPVVANTAERMDKRIADLTKRKINSPPATAEVIEKTLVKLRRQREGLPPVANRVPNTRQFPTAASEQIEGAQVPGEKVIPRSERRKHVRGLTGERNVPVTGEPQQRKQATPRGPITEPRTRPHVGPQRGSVTIPAPDLSVGERVERARPSHWDAENPNMWKESLTRGGYTPPTVTNPAVGAHVGENIWSRMSKAAVRGATGRGAKKAGAIGLGLGVGTAAFMVPDVASAWVDAPGGTTERIKALGEQSLESGIEVGASLAVFSGLVKGAQAAAPVLAPAIGAAAHLGGSAIIGGIAGTAAGGIYNRVKAVQDKNRRDAAFAKEKYGTVEAATRTRKGLKADGTPMTLNDTEEIARRWEREAAKLKRRGVKE